MDGEPRRTDSTGRVFLEKQHWTRLVAYEVHGYLKARFQLSAVKPDLVAPLLPTACVVGVIRDAHGKPLAGGQIRLTPCLPPLRIWVERPWELVCIDRRGHVWTTRADASGAFRLEGLPAGIALILKTARDGASARFHSHPPVVLDPFEERRLALRAHEIGAVDGRVVDQFGQGVGDVLVLANPIRQRVDPLLHGNRHRSERGGITDALGRFRIDDMECGRWSVETSTGHGRSHPEPVARTRREVEITSQGQVATVTLTAHRGLFVSGTVVDASGNPVRGCMMFAIVGRKRQCHNPYTDAQGSFQIGPLSPGRVEISAYLRKPLSHAAPKALHAGDSGVVLTLHAAPRRAVRGRVIDGATGQAVKARVKIVRPRTTRRSSGQLTQEDGTFQLRVFRSGANEVIAWAEPDLFGEVRGVGLRDGTATEGVLVRLRRTGKIRVTLARADLRLLRRKLLLHVELDGRRYYGLPLFERVTEVRLPPGRARVIVSLAGSNRQQPRPHPVTRVVQVTAGQTADVMLPLPPASGQ